jgi:hypothetical protein
MNTAPQTGTRSPWSNWAIARGFIAAIIVAWIFSILLMSGFPFDILFGQSNLYLSPITLSALLGLLPVFAVYGLPIATVVVLAVGAPIWGWFSDRSRTTFADAARAGAIGGTIVAAVEVFGAIMFLGPNIMSGDGPHFSTEKVFKFLFDCLCTVGIGSLAGLAYRLAAGRPRVTTHPP